MKRYLSTFLFFSFLTITLFGQVHINEYSASNLSSFTDDYGKTEDWIELYNSGNTAIDLGGWYLSDKETKPQKWAIPAGTIIPANGFLTFWCSGRDEVTNSGMHTNFKLAQTKAGEMVMLSDANGIVDAFPLALTLTEHSRCRSTDGGATWVICTSPSLNSSNNSTSQFTSYTQVPSMSLTAGFYTGTQTVSITNNEPNSVLRYTTDGKNPTTSSPEYTAPLTIESTTVVKARAFSNNAMVLPGKMDFNTYFINEDFSLAVFSVAADEVINLANGNGDLIPIGSLEYFNKNKEREATSFGSLNRHGQDSWVLPHRSIDWVSRDEMGYSKAVNVPLFGYSERDSYQKFMFRNSGDDNYPAINDIEHQGSTHIRDEYVQTLAQLGGMKLDQRAVERVILFLNGEYWGVYGLRERPVDHDYTKEYYKQGKYDLQYLTTWGNTQAQYGGNQAIQDWTNLRDFILNNDMSDSLNYQVAKDSINMVSMIDYMIVNLNVVASDWLNYNTGWWRGRDLEGKHKKWGYILWDLDATFDYYINYSGVPNTSPNAEPCDLVEIGNYMDEFFVFQPDVGQHEKIFLKLLDESPVFKQLYYSRYADMMNTVYDCDNMIHVLDSMLAVIEPEMPRQIQRWGGSMTEWQSNVQELKNFINQRCTLLDDGMLGCYDELTGPYDVTLMTQPNGIGKIDFNTLKIEHFPWSGSYFGGMENKIKAKVFNEYENDYEFSHWVSISGNVISPNSLERKARITLTQSDTLIAVFSLITATEDLGAASSFHIFPNPANDYLTLKYELKEAMDMQVALYSTLGQKVMDFPNASTHKSVGLHTEQLLLNQNGMTSGLYFLVVSAGDRQRSFKVNIVK